MPSRNIAVQREVYEALKKEKRAGESFTGLFVRLLNQRGTIEEVRGTWGEGGAEDLRRLARIRKFAEGRGR